MSKDNARPCFYYEKYIRADGETKSLYGWGSKPDVKRDTGIDAQNHLSRHRFHAADRPTDSISGGKTFRPLNGNQDIVGADTDLQSAAWLTWRMRDKKFKAGREPDAAPAVFNARVDEDDVEDVLKLVAVELRQNGAGCKNVLGHAFGDDLPSV